MFNWGKQLLSPDHHLCLICSLISVLNHFQDALLEEAQEGIHIRSDEIRKLPLYEEPSKKKKFVVPIDQGKTSTSSSQITPASSQSSSQSEEGPTSQVIQSTNLISGTSLESRTTGTEQSRSNSGSRSNSPSKNERQAKLEPIIMPAPEDLFTLHLDLVRSLHWQKPNHQEALNVMSRIQRYLDWPALIKSVPGMVENLYKISNYTKSKQVQLKAIYLYNQMKWTLFCNREIDFIEKEFPV